MCRVLFILFQYQTKKNSFEFAIDYSEASKQPACLVTNAHMATITGSSITTLSTILLLPSANASTKPQIHRFGAGHRHRQAPTRRQTQACDVPVTSSDASNSFASLPHSTFNFYLFCLLLYFLLSCISTQ